MPVNPNPTPSIFDQAARVFDGWTDPDTGSRVLCINRRGDDPLAGHWGTQYHQLQCFLDGGRRVVLNQSRSVRDPTAPENFILDLTTGETQSPFPPGFSVNDVNDHTRYAGYQNIGSNSGRTAIWDMRAERDVAEITCDGWTINSIDLLPDGKRAIAFFHIGNPYNDKVVSRHYLIGFDQPPQIILEAEGFFCSHVEPCPTDPDLYCYDRWPSPTTPVDQVLHLRRLDGSIDYPVPLNEQAVRPATTFGARDHYVWTPDGNRIVSYLCCDPIDPFHPDFDHYRLQWWLSATDWRTGEDLAAPYAPGRWGGHMQITPDSRYIITAGAPGYDRLLAVEIEALRHGWNESIICNYPRTLESEDPGGPFAYPFALPDTSGVIFCAGWPGPDHGVYLAQWPKGL